MKVYKATLTIAKLWDKNKPNLGLFSKCVRCVSKSTLKNMRKTMERLKKYERIGCNNCGKIQRAKVTVDIIFEVYIHECINCGYIIMESEWERK